MARRTVLGLLASGATVLLGGCRLGGGNSYRFRMTVEVGTPLGPIAGSSVFEVWAQKNHFKLLAEENAGSGGVRGEALTVDLPTGPLFVLLKNDNSGQPLGVRVTSALTKQKTFRNVDDYVSAVGSLRRGFGSAVAELAKGDWPMMVRFDDINDSRTVETVSPDAIGVRRIIVETTNQDVTTGLRRRLPWLENGGLTLDPGGRPTITPTLPQTIRQRAFSTEVPQ